MLDEMLVQAFSCYLLYDIADMVGVVTEMLCNQMIV